MIRANATAALAGFRRLRSDTIASWCRRKLGSRAAAVRACAANVYELRRQQRRRRLLDGGVRAHGGATCANSYRRSSTSAVAAAAARAFTLVVVYIYSFVTYILRLVYYVRLRECVCGSSMVLFTRVQRQKLIIIIESKSIGPLAIGLKYSETFGERHFEFVDLSGIRF